MIKQEEPCEGRLSSTVPWEREGETPLRDPIGGICNWIIAIAAVYVEFDIQLLLLALAVLVGYIIPGHMLSNHYKKNIQ